MKPKKYIYDKKLKRVVLQPKPKPSDVNIAIVMKEHPWSDAYNARYKS